MGIKYFKQGLAYLNYITCRNADDGKHYEGGIKEYVKYLNAEKVVVFPEPVYVEGEENGIVVEAALQYTTDVKDSLRTFTNNINTYEGGTHETGFKNCANTRYQ